MYNLKNEEIIKLYIDEKISSNEIAKKLGISTTPIRSRLRKLGLLKHVGYSNDKNISYHIDEKYFEKVETLEKCWVLGWLYSDGYNNEYTGDIRITLNNRDYEVLEKINKEIKNERPIFLVPKYNQAILIINRKKMSEDLAKLGCVKKKSLVIKWPYNILDSKLKICAFLRGIFEGDGCLCISKIKKRGFYIQFTIACCSIDFC